MWCTHLNVCSCLSEKKGEKDFSKACKKEVEEYEQEVSQDYRFNPRLKKSCDRDIKELCPGLCNENDGNVSHHPAHSCAGLFHALLPSLC